MTERLYLNDSYIKENDAEVIAAERTENGFLIELDKSVFFPTSGGQPHDTGALDGAEVLDVTEKGERVLHLTTRQFKAGDTVRAKINWERRFDHMQQHSGEHVLSFAAKELYDSANIGFHMAADYCTVDFDRAFSKEELFKIEEYANELICKNLPVTLTYVDAEQLEGLTLRKKAKGLTGVIRIVSITDCDSCTCCGTHVNFTGEIGAFKITESAHYKGGERVTFVCGARAVRHSRAAQNIVDGLANGFSCKGTDVPGAVKRLKEQSGQLKREQKILYDRLSEYISDELINGAKTAGKTKVIACAVELPADRLKPLGLLITQKERAVALLVSKNDETLNYVVCCTEPLDAGEFIESVNAALNGKGGGRKTLAQGSAKYRRGLDEALEQLEQYFLSRLKQ